MSEKQHEPYKGPCRVSLAKSTGGGYYARWHLMIEDPISSTILVEISLPVEEFSRMFNGYSDDVPMTFYGGRRVGKKFESVFVTVPNLSRNWGELTPSQRRARATRAANSQGFRASVGWQISDDLDDQNYHRREGDGYQVRFHRWVDSE